MSTSHHSSSTASSVVCQQEEKENAVIDGTGPDRDHKGEVALAAASSTRRALTIGNRDVDDHRIAEGDALEHAMVIDESHSIHPSNNEDAHSEEGNMNIERSEPLLAQNELRLRGALTLDNFMGGPFRATIAQANRVARQPPSMSNWQGPFHSPSLTAASVHGREGQSNGEDFNPPGMRPHERLLMDDIMGDMGTHPPALQRRRSIDASVPRRRIFRLVPISHTFQLGGTLDALNNSLTRSALKGAIPSTTFSLLGLDARGERACPICFEDYRPETVVGKMPNCSHWFCQRCAEMHVARADACPICRQDVLGRSSDELQGEMPVLVSQSGTTTTLSGGSTPSALQSPLGWDNSLILSNDRQDNLVLSGPVQDIVEATTPTTPSTPFNYTVRGRLRPRSTVPRWLRNVSFQTDPDPRLLREPLTDNWRDTNDIIPEAALTLQRAHNPLRPRRGPRQSLSAVVSRSEVRSRRGTRSNAPSPLPTPCAEVVTHRAHPYEQRRRPIPVGTVQTDQTSHVQGNEANRQVHQVLHAHHTRPIAPSAPTLLDGRTRRSHRLGGRDNSRYQETNGRNDHYSRSLFPRVPNLAPLEERTPEMGSSVKGTVANRQVQEKLHANDTRSGSSSNTPSRTHWNDDDSQMITIRNDTASNGINSALDTVDANNTRENVRSTSLPPPHARRRPPQLPLTPTKATQTTHIQDDNGHRTRTELDAHSPRSTRSLPIAHTRCEQCQSSSTLTTSRRTAHVQPDETHPTRTGLDSNSPRSNRLISALPTRHGRTQPMHVSLVQGNETDSTVLARPIRPIPTRARTRVAHTPIGQFTTTLIPPPDMETAPPPNETTPDETRQRGHEGQTPAQRQDRERTWPGERRETGRTFVNTSGLMEQVMERTRRVSIRRPRPECRTTEDDDRRA